MLLLNDVWANWHPRFILQRPRIVLLLIASARLDFPSQPSKKLCEIVSALTIFSAIMVLLAALDIWIWVPLH
jgi:hypothetical protein